MQSSSQDMCISSPRPQYCIKKVWYCTSLYIHSQDELPGWSTEQKRYQVSSCIHSDIEKRAPENGGGPFAHPAYLTHVIGLCAKEKPRGEISSHIYYLTRFLHPSSGLHKNTFIIRPICRRERKNNSHAKPHSSV